MSSLARIFAFVILSGLLVGCSTKVNRENSKAADINVRLGLSYLKQNRLDLAETKLKRALEMDDKSSRVHWVYAMLEEKLDNNEKAEKHFRRAIKLNSRDSDAYNNYGSFLCRKGRVQEGIVAFESAVDNPLYRHPEYAYTNAGICMLRNQKEMPAEVYFKKALVSNPQYAPALYQLALILHNQKRYLNSRSYRARLMASLTKPDPKALALCVKTERAMYNHDVADTCASELKSKFPQSQEASGLY